MYLDSLPIKFYLDVTTFSHFAGLIHLDNFITCIRLATRTQKSCMGDWWQASTPAHLPGFKTLRHLTASRKSLPGFVTTLLPMSSENMRWCTGKGSGQTFSQSDVCSIIFICFIFCCLIVRLFDPFLIFKMLFY